jgi:hypothetical protein
MNSNPLSVSELNKENQKEQTVNSGSCCNIENIFQNDPSIGFHGSFLISQSAG